MPAAGKTGTTQNWADAWTSGFTPYYTSTFWFGFDKPGQSLGLKITGATLAGYAWGEYMGEIHRGMIAKDFPKPMDGVIQVTVCSESGMLPSAACGDHLTTQWYLLGTQPVSVCTLHSNTSPSILAVSRLRKERYQSGQNLNVQIEKSPLKLNLDFLNENIVPHTQEEAVQEEDLTVYPDYNPFME